MSIGEADCTGNGRVKCDGKMPTGKRATLKARPAARKDDGTQISRLRRLCLSIPGTMEKLSLNDIFTPEVLTGVDMENGYLPLVLFANEDMIIEVANCDREQGGWHRNLGADEWAFQYKGSRTINSETGPVTINEGEMTVIPRGIAHQNVGHGPNIEITIYSKKTLHRLCPKDVEEARARMKIQNGKPIVPPVTLDTKFED